jgi:hypothetical protein
MRAEIRATVMVSVAVLNSTLRVPLEMLVRIVATIVLTKGVKTQIRGCAQR